MLFYNTLFDENAASHIALGQCYADCFVEKTLTPEEIASPQWLGSEGQPSLSIAVVPLVEPDTARIAGAMLLLGKCRVCDELSIDAFGRLHALTMAEQRVLRLLCAGRRPAAIRRCLARELGVFPEEITRHGGHSRLLTGATKEPWLGGEEA